MCALYNFTKRVDTLVKSKIVLTIPRRIILSSGSVCPPPNKARTTGEHGGHREPSRQVLRIGLGEPPFFEFVEVLPVSSGTAATREAFAITIVCEATSLNDH